MKQLIMIAIGGAGGALCRHALMHAISTFSTVKFPTGTLAVNLIGSFCIGIMYVMIIEKMALHPDWRSVLVVGFLGAFTTFSTFSLDIITLLEQGHIGNAMLYSASSIITCVVACWLAIALTRLL